MMNLRDSHILNHKQNLEWNWLLIATILKVRPSHTRAHTHAHGFFQVLTGFCSSPVAKCESKEQQRRTNAQVRIPPMLLPVGASPARRCEHLLWCVCADLCGGCCTFISPAVSCMQFWPWTTPRPDSSLWWAVSLWSFSWTRTRLERE